MLLGRLLNAGLESTRCTTSAYWGLSEMSQSGVFLDYMVPNGRDRSSADAPTPLTDSQQAGPHQSIVKWKADAPQRWFSREVLTSEEEGGSRWKR